MNSRSRATIAALLSTSVLACAQAAPPKSAAPPPPPTTVAEARVAIARAREELGDASVAPLPPAAPVNPAGGATSQAGPSVATAAKAAADDAERDKGATSRVQEESPAAPKGCPRRCDASHSLDRATQALCALVGEEDAECKEARAAALRGEQAVALCNCR